MLDKAIYLIKDFFKYLISFRGIVSMACGGLMGYAFGLKIELGIIGAILFAYIIFESGE